MTPGDRELLTLAARAAGYDVDFGNGAGTRHIVLPDGDLWRSWNPLEFDGDAFGLMVDCGITPHQWNDAVGGCSSGDGCEIEYFINHPDRAAATRRAIVRAAAELGRQKE